MESSERTTPGTKLAQLRDEARWTQEELSEASGVTRPQISLIEQGRVEPRRSTRMALAEALSKKLGRRITHYFDSETLSVVVRPTTAIAEARPFYDVFDFMAGLVEWPVEAEVACGEPLDYSVHGETALIPDGEKPDERKGERLLRARGDSMIEFGIRDGTYIVAEMREGGVAASGELVIAWFNDGITMKRYIRAGGRAFLQAGSAEYPSYEVTSNDVYQLKAIVRRKIAVDYFPKISG